MAGGLGTRLFVQGDVISAADVNGYLMNQSIMRFATTAARDTAFGNGIAVGSTVGGVAGDGKPLLQEGMFAYIDLNNDVTYYNGSQWVSAPTFVLADGEVTTVKIADDAVTSAKIADGAITAAHIADGTIIAADIADGSVTSAKILDGTIVNADINAAAAIALGKLADATIDIKTGNYTLQLTDKNKFIKMNIASTANTVTVPLDSTVTFPEGAQIHIIQYGTGKTQIVGASGSVILYSTPGAYLRAQYSSATLLKCATANTWMLMGDLSAS